MRVRVLVAMLAAILIAAPGMAATLDVPGTYPTISAAVAAAATGDVIQIAAGSYMEQVIINGKDLTLQGAGDGVTVVQAPTTLASAFLTSTTNCPIICALNAADVRVQDMTIDGLGRGNGNYRFEGISFWDAGGKVLRCTVKDIRETPLNGNQHGVAIYSYNDDSAARTLEVGWVTMTGYQKNGTALSGNGLSVNVHDCVAVGTGDTGVIAQNGIQVSYGAGGSVSNCATSNMRYTNPASAISCGVLIYSAGSPVAVSGLNGAASPVNVQLPVYFSNSSGTIDGVQNGANTSDYNAVFVGNFDTSAPVHSSRPLPRISPVPGSGGRTGSAAPYAVTISNCDLTGTNTVGVPGLYIYSAGGAMTTAVSTTYARNWDEGIYVAGAASVCTTHDCSITGNTTAGYHNVGGAAQDATGNWWGSSAGPGATGVVGANVTSSPWRFSGVDTSPAVGFQPGPENPVSVGAAPTCITPAHPCVTVPVTIARTDATPVRGFSVTVQLSASLALCSSPGVSIVEGGYLSSFNPNITFQVIDLGGGLYEVDGSILGGTCGTTASSGTLFTIDAKAAGGDGSGTISVTSTNLRLRDCANGSIPVTAGGSSTLTIDTGAPATVTGLSATQVKSGNDGDGTTKITLAYTAPGDAASVEVYRAGFGNYPEYDDAPGAGSVPVPPASYPPSAPWTLTPVTASGQTDEPAARDVWYYVAFVKDGCGNVSSASAMTGGVLNYHLGDVSNGVTAGQGNNHVATEDISLLGAHYGLSGAAVDPFNYLDVGPTTTGTVDGRPTTDNKIEFEDLILFAINYATAAAPRRGAPTAAGNELVIEMPSQPPVGSEFTARLTLRGSGNIQGVSTQLRYDAAVVEPIAVEAGDLLAAQRAPGVVLSSAPGVVDAALLGRGAGFEGSGDVARVTFRVLAAGNAAVSIGRVTARDAANQPVELTTSAGTTPVTSVPRESFLGNAAPQPFTTHTTLTFGLARESKLTLDVFDARGRRVREIASGTLPAGVHAAVWDGRDAAGREVGTGVYVVRLDVEGRVFTTSTRRIR